MITRQTNRKYHEFTNADFLRLSKNSKQLGEKYLDKALLIYNGKPITQIKKAWFLPKNLGFHIEHPKHKETFYLVQRADTKRWVWVKTDKSKEQTELKFKAPEAEYAVAALRILFKILDKNKHIKQLLIEEAH